MSTFRRSRGRSWKFFVALAALSGALAADLGRAAGQIVLYHGYVTNARNEPVSGAFAVTFKLYDAPTAGNEVWSEAQNVTLDAGNLAAALGGTTPLTPATFAGGALYLGVKIGSEELPGRQPVGSVPLALHAADAKGLAGLPVVSAGCTAGQSLTFSASGWTCASAAAYTGGPGIQVAGTVISLPTSCASGQLLKWNGTAWACAGDDDTGYTAGAGLSMIGNSFSLLATCQQGQILKWNGTTWACAGDDNTGKTYAAGDGLSLNEATGTFALKATCGEGQVLKRVGGAWACAADADTLFSAAANGGLSLTGNGFGLVSCPDGQVLKSTGTGWACNFDSDTPVDVLERGGLRKVGNDFGLISCSSGQVLKYNSGLTQWMCADDIVGTPGATYTPGDGLVINGTQFSVMPCSSSDEYLRWTGTSWACVSDWIGGVIQPEYGGLGADISNAGTGTLLYKGLTGWTLLAPSTDGQVLKLVGGEPRWAVDVAGSGTVTSITAGAGLTGGTITTTGTLAVAFAGTGSLSTAARSDHTHDTGSIVSGTLPIARGGTGATTASGALSSLGGAARGANNDITSLAGLTTALSVGQGGTGATSASGARSGLGAAASGANSDITSLGGLTTALSLGQGGTGATSALGARSSLGAAASGANSDISSLSGLTTALSVSQGGTGAANAGAALTNLGGAARGANTDITSLGGLTTALSIGQGGTGATTAAGARSGIGAAASGSNGDITSLTGLTTALSLAQGGTGATSATGARSSLGAAASGANSDITSLTGLTTLTAANPTSASGATALIGQATASTGTNATRGVMGTTASPGPSSAGVYGLQSAQTGGPGFGVYGQSDGPGGSGVAGTANGSGGRGVYGEAVASNGAGVFGYVYATTGINYGVYGEVNSAAGFGLFTPNRAHVGGTLTVGNGITATPAGALTAGGTVTASSFSGSGASLTGITGSNITDNSLALSKLSSSGCGSNFIPRWSGSSWSCVADSTGTVTSVAVGSGLSSGGSAITSSGTINLSLAAGGGLSSTIGTGNVQLGIASGGISFSHLGQNSCGTNGIPRWGGSSWSCVTDSTGTVTSVATGQGLQGSITTTGTIDLRLNTSGGLSKTLGGSGNELGLAAGGISLSHLGENSCAGGDIIKRVGSAWTCAADSTGTVTSVAAGNGLSTGGGAITGSGTINLSLAAAGGLSVTAGTGTQLGIAAGGVTGTHLASASVGLSHLAQSGCGTDAVPKFNGTAWTCGSVAAAAVESIPTTNVVNQVSSANGYMPSVSVAADGLPVIAYSSPLTLVRCGNPSCSTRTSTALGSSYPQFQGLQMVMGANGNPFIAYIDAANPNIYYLKVTQCGDVGCTAGNVTTTLDSSAGSELRYVSTAVGLDGNPLVAHTRDGSGLRLAVCSQPGCASGTTVRSLDPSAPQNTTNAIVVPPDGKPFLIYAGGTGLKGLKCADATCSSSTSFLIDSADYPNNIGPPAIAISSNGAPVFAYQVPNGAKVKLGFCSDMDCNVVPGGFSGTLMTIESGTADRAVSLAIPADGFPVVGYGSATGYTVAKCRNPNCMSTIKTLVSTAAVGSEASMTLGGDGLPFVVYGGGNNPVQAVKCVNRFCLPYWSRR